VTWRAAILGSVTLLIVAGIASLGAIPQDPNYHIFADQRDFGGAPNFLNVISNLPFLVFGILGWRMVHKNEGVVIAETRLAWMIFFFGVALTAFGSGYFHWQPNNESLVWDRLPMTIGFMSLLSIIISEYFSPALGKKLLIPLLLVGSSSVAFWAYTESIGAGDLRPYAVVQFLPILLIPIIISLYRERSDLGRCVWWMIGFYVLAKILEYYDFELYSFGRVVSGHSLKHLAASLAPASLVYILIQRRNSAEQGRNRR
jgi:hypothetical protein